MDEGKLLLDGGPSEAPWCSSFSHTIFLCGDEKLPPQPQNHLSARTEGQADDTWMQKRNSKKLKA
jgi:hypothetical protein